MITSIGEPEGVRTIIHIGQHKTGTTSIQHYLRGNKASLAKQGLYVPDTVAGFTNVTHGILSVYSLGKKRFSPAKDRLLASRTPLFFWSLGEKLKSDIAQHYQRAKEEGCKDVIWSSEGLYLLNSESEYKKLIDLFSAYSSEMIVVCCFRETESFRTSYMKQLEKNFISFSQDRDSHRYVERDSWLFDYERKKKLLSKLFDDLIFFAYTPDDMVGKFMSLIGYPADESEKFRLNVTPNTDQDNGIHSSFLSLDFYTRFLKQVRAYVLRELNLLLMRD